MWEEWRVYDASYPSFGIEEQHGFVAYDRTSGATQSYYGPYAYIGYNLNVNGQVNIGGSVYGTYMYASSMSLSGSGAVLDVSGATNTTGNSNYIKVGSSATIYDGTSGSNNALNFGGKYSYRFLGSGRALYINPSSGGVVLTATVTSGDTNAFTISSNGNELRLKTDANNKNIVLTPNGTGRTSIPNGGLWMLS